MTEAAKLLTADDVRERLRREIAKAGSISAWARNNSVTKQYVSQFLSGHNEAGRSILGPLGIRKLWRAEYRLDETADVR